MVRLGVVSQDLQVWLAAERTLWTRQRAGIGRDPLTRVDRRIEDVQKCQS